MLDELKKDWRILKSNPPGRRFQERYRYRRELSPASAAGRIARAVLGVVLVLAGVILWFIPGPGWLTIILGLALLAGHSRWLSRFLDAAEVRIRRFIPRYR